MAGTTQELFVTLNDLHHNKKTGFLYPFILILANKYMPEIVFTAIRLNNIMNCVGKYQYYTYMLLIKENIPANPSICQNILACPTISTAYPSISYIS